MLHWMIKDLGSGIVFGERDYLKDQIILYQGLYGNPTYFIWYCAPDKTRKIHMGSLLTLAMYRGEEDIVYADRFTVRTHDFDVKTQMYRIIAKQVNFKALESYVVLKSYTFSTDKEQLISGYGALNTILSKMSSLELVRDLNLTDKVGYVSMSFDRDTTVMDVVTKICADNRWEFYIKENKLFISNSFSVEGANIYPVQPWAEQKKEIDSTMFKNIILEADVCEPGALYGEKGKEWRVIWVKFYLGGDVGSMMSVGLFRYLDVHITEKDFIETLTDMAYERAKFRLHKKLQSSSILSGKIYGEYNSFHLDQYESPIFSGDIENMTKDLNTRTFQTNFPEGIQGNLYVKNIKKTTPYAGDQVGLLFPQDDSHGVLFAPDGDREVGLIGPSYFGPNEEIPKRNSVKDFRLQLPNAVIYIKENGEIIIEQSGDHSTVPSGSNPSVRIGNDGTIYIDSTSQINIGDSSPTIQIGGASALELAQALHTHSTGNLGITIPPGSPNTSKLKGA